MVKAVITAIPEDWEAVVVMDWSGGFWDRMVEKYETIVILWFIEKKQRGQVESAGKSRQRVGGENPPHGNG